VRQTPPCTSTTLIPQAHQSINSHPGFHNVDICVVRVSLLLYPPLWLSPLGTFVPRSFPRYTRGGLPKARGLLPKSTGYLVLFLPPYGSPQPISFLAFFHPHDMLSFPPNERDPPSANAVSGFPGSFSSFSLMLFFSERSVLLHRCMRPPARLPRPLSSMPCSLEIFAKVPPTRREKRTTT